MTDQTISFNDLTPAQAERLAFLAEELAEAVCAIGKILRHGYESGKPDDEEHPGNRAALVAELGHVAAAAALLEHAGDINDPDIWQEARVKLRDARQWMHHQESWPET